MYPELRIIAENIKNAFVEIGDVEEKGTLKSRHIFKALRSNRELMEKMFGGPIRCRHSGYHSEDKAYCSDPSPFKVLEYLLDFSFSRYSIPEAIGDERTGIVEGIQFELLFAAESELGPPMNIYRDFLKLLDIRSRLRCLLFRKRSGEPEKKIFKGLLATFRNHVHSRENCHGWLFVTLEKQNGTVKCEFYSLNRDFSDFDKIEFN